MKTALYERHLRLGAKIVSFADWEMPLQYQGILLEHQTVRQKVGLFDVSHMGRIWVRGQDAESLLDYLSTNVIKNKPPFHATYTTWCDVSGKCIDDLIIYRVSSEVFFIVVNASNREKDLKHLLKYAKEKNVLIEDCYEDGGIIALQGPSSFPLLYSLFPSLEQLQPMEFSILPFLNEDLFIARTGYTGAGGFEFYGNNDQISVLWDGLMEQGELYGIQPIGLGARDTLRLEMGFALYGHELSEIISPIESVASWAIKWDKEDFLGKSALKDLDNNPLNRYAYGVFLHGDGIPRQDYLVYKDGHQIGKVTSGSYSPSLQKGIALILVQEKLTTGQTIEIQIRQNRCPAEVVPLPFVRKAK